MTQGFTNPLTEIGIMNLPRGKVRPVRKADKITAIYEPAVYGVLDPRSLTPSTASYRDIFTLCYFLDTFLFLLTTAKQYNDYEEFCLLLRNTT
jgi:hypothetical protein